MAGMFKRGIRSAQREGDASPALVPIAETDVVRRLELLDSFESAGLGWFWATDAQGRMVYLSRNAMDRLGLSEDDVIGRPLGDLFIPDQLDDPDRAERPLAFLLGARNSIVQLPVRLAAQNGAGMWWEIAGKPQFDARQNFTGYRGSAKDITATREVQKDAERLAAFDSLTGLANRHRMEKRLSTTLAAYRHAKRSCALMMLDLDRFKQVNDTLGHPAGDELLKQVADRLRTIVGDKGEIGRLGGDEFQIVIADVDDRGVLGDLGQRLIQMISQPYSINGARAIIGTSVGIAVAPYDGVDTEELVKAADLALYSAKGGGRGQYRFYSAELKDGAALRRQTEEDLRDAIANSGLVMHYQPLVDAKTHQVRCFEALMRWEHPDRGNIPPTEFIPVAEDIGVIKQMGEWALLQVCRDAQEWPRELSVAVNVSAIQFAHDDFPLAVQRALEKSELEPQRLELEITESVFMGDGERTNRVFAELKALGVRLALDDFGTGYSSLSYLRNAPFDKIKIDQSFVRGATEDGNNNAAIITAIVGLAQALGMETVAEGVETKDELRLVGERGANLVQGFIFSRPSAHQDVMDRLAKGKLKYEPRGPERYRAERRTLFRRIGLIHEDHRYRVVLRNLSKTGAMIEGLLEVPVGTDVVVDLGGGQLAVATVRRSKGHVQGLEFETPLISDGADGLCTRHRVSPYDLETAGRPLAALPQDAYGALAGSAPSSRPRKFMEVDVGAPRLKPAPVIKSTP